MSSEKHADELYKSSIVIDNLQSSIWTDEYFQTVLKAGLTATNKTVAGGGGTDNLSVTMTKMAEWNRSLQKHPDVACIATKTDDIYQAKKNGKVAYISGFQDTLMIETHVDFLDLFYKLGVRIIQLTYNTKNLVGDGCGERTDCGLSQFGLDVIDRMNSLGMVVDIGHVGDRTSNEAIERAKVVVCSHANARSVCNNVRNKTDETIRALAKKDGVIGVNAFPSFVKWTKMEKGERPTVEDLLDHVDYIVKLVGINHVGLGLDLIDNWPLERHRGLDRRPDIWGRPTPKGTYDYAVGIDHVTGMINIARGLVKRGYSDVDVKKVLGENWIRVYKKVLD